MARRRVSELKLRQSSISRGHACFMLSLLYLVAILLMIVGWVLMPIEMRTYCITKARAHSAVPRLSCLSSRSLYRRARGVSRELLSLALSRETPRESRRRKRRAKGKKERNARAVHRLFVLSELADARLDAQRARWRVEDETLKSFSEREPEVAAPESAEAAVAAGPPPDLK